MSNLPTSILGRTGLEVTRLGFGAAELHGGPKDPKARIVSRKAAGRILNAVLDVGINLIDTAPDYGLSEERIGESISARRDEYYLASKCGCPIDHPMSAPGPHIFTRENIRAGVEQSLRRMKTDYLDLMQFHGSPSRKVLEDNDSIAELRLLQEEGKVRFIAAKFVQPAGTPQPGWHVRVVNC